MSLLSESTVNNDGCVFRQSFINRRYVMDASGVLVGCTVGRYGPGIMPTAASSRVTYDNTRALLINASKMTIRFNLRMPSALAANVSLLTKWPNGLADNQFALEMLSNRRPLLYVCNAAGDFGQYSLVTNALDVSTSHILHAVYDGALAAGSRVAWYDNGSPIASAITGVIPVTMRAGGSPITIFNRYTMATMAPPADTTLFDAEIWGRAFSAQECADDAADRTFL